MSKNNYDHFLKLRYIYHSQEKNNQFEKFSESRIFENALSVYSIHKKEITKIQTTTTIKS